MRLLSNSILAGTIFVVLLSTFARPVRCPNVQNVLTPPYFNLAEGRPIIASATCGEGVEEPELFCKLVGANSEKKEDNENLIIQGQVCDHCIPKDLDKRHPAEYAVDGQETWWQSPPLSRGMKYNEVNLTIDLGQEFHVAYVIIKMANSPRPGVWVLERSADNGQTFWPWQYFADTVGDCQQFFGNNISIRITSDDSVICDTQFSKIVPLEGGEIIVPLVQNRPSANDFFNSVLLQEWTRATNVRFRFLRVKNLLGHLMSMARQDPTTTRRYFYSVKDISIGGRCRCNGHAEVCDLQDPSDSYKLICNCQHNTCGHNCEVCCPGFEQKRWSQSKNNRLFVCERCNCFSHTDQCVYNETVDDSGLSLDIHGKYEGGGVCQNCQHNTKGINCDKCIDGYYRPFQKPLNATDVCQPCQCNYHYATGNCFYGTGQCECKPEYTKPNCDSCSLGYFGYPNCRPCECFLNGTRSFQCEAEGGQCPCKPNFGGKYCKQCSEGYYKHPDCKACNCNAVGSESTICDINNGDCKCKNNYGGRSCDQCTNGYYSFPSCTFCNCDTKGTTSDICDKSSGKCICKPGYGGPRCDQCLPGYTGFPDCKSCNCSTIGSAYTTCDLTGKCYCLANYGGKTCDQCSPGYYKYPDCLPCNCSIYGMEGNSCDNEGRCRCKPNFDGMHCEKCREGFYKFPTCEECKFDPAGVISNFSGCGSLRPDELVRCKPKVTGTICNECKELYWNLQIRNPEGCEECQCETNGTVGRIGTCNTKTGQCICKPFTASRRCDECEDGFYNLSDDNLFGCTGCDCDIGGSINGVCDKNTGQCACQPRIKGKTCREPELVHYFPTLHQYQYEVEDGVTPAQTPVRYGFDEDVFPEYSWKGYAVFSHLQNETLHSLVISKSSIYRVIFRYINTNDQAILATISAMPEDPNNIDLEQKFQVLFKPTRTPTFVTVAGVTGNNPSPFVLNPGGWIFKISSQSGLFLDYFVIIPAEYYEADLLVYDVDMPCLINTTGLCRHYQYPLLEKFVKVNGVDSYVISRDAVKEPPKRHLHDAQHLRVLNIRKIPELSLSQRELNFDIEINKQGDHVFLVNYISKSTDDGSVTIPLIVEIGDKAQRGFVSLYPCKYTMLCRKVALNKDGRVAVFNLDNNYVKATLKNDESETIFGIESLVAIPYKEWHLNYIQPKPSCIRKDGVCMPSTYLTPPDSKRIDFKTGDERRISKILPSTIYDNTTELIYLDKDDPMFDLSGKVPKSGPYVFVVHYYQPDFPEFEMNVLIHNGQSYEGKLPVQHCPSNSGCRAIIQQKDNNNKVFSLTENVLITLKEPDHKNIWLHYVLIIPLSAYNEDIVDEQPFDQTALFLSECGKNSFRLNVSESGFCRDATYSLTTKYNDGVLLCACDFDGTIGGVQCNPYGGQCPCRENVIGRRCDNCRTGYFGFPHCKACDCPSTAYCEPTTGQCVCPQNVQGEKCDQCVPYTFGFHPIIGCEECNCNIVGVKNNNLQCDLSDGLCECRENIEGRTCDRCRSGFWSFPHCLPCECDLRGTSEEICNKSSSSCYCKSNVQGVACDICKPGTFNLLPDNEEGCTKCFCFGRTKRCSSSALFRTEASNSENWTVVIVNVSKSVEINTLALTPEVKVHEISVDMTLIIQGIAYVAAPEIYLGNKLTAYGGFLNYTFWYITPGGGVPVSGADVILYGSNIYLFYNSVEQPVESENYFSTLQIIENNFVTISNSPATREQLMQVLQNLTALYIRVTYWDQTLKAKVTGVRLEMAVSQYSEFASLALAVEQCSCPPNYVGLSCEECADGYFRSPNGTFGGFCIPCQCNGHASTCDKITGVCQDCKHNTFGDHCEMCEIGYYGNATYGTTNDCLICACPLPIPSNNFATSCNINEQGDKIDCECLPGYAGSRCELCAPGYYGRPDSPGDRCVPCRCNGNIDVYDPQSCDPITGECLKCLNNTFGKDCSICAPGYFGDALIKKNCQSCACDKCGTKVCDHETGECTCHNNVIGEKCDRCADKHYGFSTCSGCSPCDCALASDSLQCEDIGGHCRCKPGVVGRMCDKCAAGFFKYTVNGCTSCGCNIGYSVGVGCNAETGSCECLPGVIGDKCDTCPYRNILIPGEGCFQCDKCVHGLLDSTDALRDKLNPIVNQFQTVALGYFTVQRLIFLNNTVNHLSHNVSDIHASQFDLTPFTERISNLSKNGTLLQREVKTLLQDALDAAKKGELTYKEAVRVQGLIEIAIATARTTVQEINNLAYTLETGTGPQTDYAVTEGKKMLNDIQEAKIADKTKEDADASLARTKKLSETIKDMTGPLNDTLKQFEILRNDLNTIDDKLSDVDNYLQSAHKTIVNTVKLNDMNRMAKLNDKLSSIENTANEANSSLANSTLLLSNASVKLELAKKNYENLGANATSLQETKMKVEHTIDNQAGELFQIKDLISKAKHHAADLENQADILDSLTKGSRVSSETAVQAATSYKNIVQAIEEAFNASLKARQAAENATEKSNGLPEISKKMYDNSTVLLEAARLALQSVKDNLPPELDNAVNLIEILAKVNGQIEKGFKEIDLILEGLRPLKMKRSVSDELPLPEQVSQSASDTLNSIQDIITNLPDDLKRAEQLRFDREDIAKSIPQGLGYVNKTEKQLPNLSETLHRVKNKSAEVHTKDTDVKSLLENLRQKIAETRDSVDKIKVGINVTKGSVELRVPSNIHSQSVSSYISLYLKTNATTGLVMYLGNEVGTSKKIRKLKTDDFIAVVLDAGYLVLLIDLGVGDTKEVKNAKFVADNRWYKILIERTGKSARLSVLQDLGNDKIDTTVVDGVLYGPWSVLNLDRNHSRLFIGGVPTTFDTTVKTFYNPFNGCLEELTIGDARIGLWDFVKKLPIPIDATDSKIMDGAHERDTFIYKPTSSAYRLNGEGYIMLSSRGYDVNRRSSIVLLFKTTASNGLLFLASKDNTFESLEIKQGYILYQYNVGRDSVTLLSGGKFNDDQWHKIEAVRDENRGKLIVDGKSQADTERSDEKVAGLSVPEFFYIGGHPSDHKLSNVTKIPFDGCIDQVFIGSTSVDLNKNANARGLSSGCVDKFTSFVSFEEGGHGYAKWINATSTNNHFEITLRFKTKASNGLLVYGSIDDKTSFRLLLSDGNLMFASGGQEVSSSQILFNDDQWHPIMAVHNDDGLKLIVDDFDMFSLKGVPTPSRFLFNALYFGSVPADIDISAASENQFVGCIGDATFNGAIVNFGTIADTPGATIGRCSGPPQKPYQPATSSPKTTSTEKQPGPVIPEITTAKPKTTPAPSIPIGLCALPPMPASDPDITDQSGYRFGTSRNSGLVYEFELLQNKKRYEFSIDMKTISQNGLIFYVSHRNSSDFLMLSLHEGKISFTVNNGANNKSVVTLMSSGIINNGEWHNVNFSISQRQIKLSVDHSVEEKLNITNNLILEPPYYLGAVESPSLTRISVALKEGQTTFEGCIRNFKANNKVVGDATKNVAVIPCSSNVESGVFFNSPGGYIMAREKFKIGSDDLFIKLRIKPRNISGLLVAVFGKKNYAVLQMNNGTINFTIESGGGPVSALYVPPSPYYFCDGKWHAIEALKAANVIIITVDKQQIPPVFDMRLGEIITEHPLFIGGYPWASKRRLFERLVPYIGCMQNIEINGKPETIIESKNVTLSVCPTI